MLLLCLILVTVLGVNGDCTIEDIGKNDGVCSASAVCYGTTETINEWINDWQCIKTNRRSYNRITYQYEYEQDDYNLNIHIKDIDDSEDPLIGIYQSITVSSLNIENGNLVAIPTIIPRLLTLKELDITYNKVESINLNEISGVSVTYLNLSHNSISNIENEIFDNSFLSYMAIIDLSHNSLESLPDNCFEKFPQLKYLDLSHNMIMQFDILTFEGIAQLETLQLSGNKISEVGHNFARFKNLKKLTLDQNQISSLTDFNFRTLVNLETLNLSFNLIKHIESQSFATLTKLEQLDLSYNKITAIPRTLFESNENMFKLSLSHNDIEKIEGGAFRTTNITQFDIQNNMISGSIEYDTFLGISVESLNLSNGNLKVLGDKAFTGLGRDLMYLNLSANSIESITDSAFQSLGVLSKLDLSYNNLIDIDFITSDLIQLTEYSLHNNKIKKITSKMFNNMTNLVKLDLSQNEIADIDFNSFVELTNLKDLNMRNNDFINSLSSNLFRGLYRVHSLDVSNTMLMSCFNESFSGMQSLTYLNMSHSQIKMVEYETFKATGAIKIIDLSYNMLENFQINTSSIYLLSELFLNHNKLKNITSETFKHLRFLEKLNLACNNILSIDSNSLQTLSHLRFLDLYSNSNLRVKGDIFNNLFLIQVSLSNVRQRFQFQNSVNTSITTLILTKCEIDDINSVCVYKFRNVFKLDITSNKIEALDKGSFQDMDDLNWLDISFNRISFIQPGTFLTNKMINTLNLYGNNIKYLQFGILDGLKNLRVLNLSNNEIHTFGVNLLHNSPHLSQLFLENNNLASMNFAELSETSVELLTIGGNKISCDQFAEWNKLNLYTLNVTAERFDFNSENVLGIRCKTNLFREKTQSQNYNINISSETIEIKESVKQLYTYLKNISVNETFTKIIALLENFTDNTGKVSANLSHSQMISNEQIKSFLNENKHLIPQLVNTSDSVANHLKLMISLLEINNNLTELNKEFLQTVLSSKIVDRKESLNLTDILLKLHSAEPLEVKSDSSILTEMKVLLYFIAVSLTIVILLCVVIMTYKYLYSQASHRIRANHLYDSGQSVRDGLEME